ncbi:NUDIX hydrolase [Paenibacillus campi]|uniref:NUDIX hydrolase n=1 Tax=Paenibacillus campi TaxID=3106031 RepID=UPI002AFF1FF3|nr:NUDIX domain-containing protein [Paenibacillus sp. SGZ-1014]
MAAYELLDIYDEQDRHLGVCTRAEVHRLGHWHHTFHCWLVHDTEAGRMLVFQKRQHTKDTFPNLYDITAAGHLLAGETMEQAVRELEEELGVPLRFNQLTPLFVTRDEWVGEGASGRLIDREVSSVFGACSPFTLQQYRLQADEVAGLFEAPLIQMLELFHGERTAVEAIGVYGQTDGTIDAEQPYVHVQVTLEQFVPQPHGYYEQTCTSLQQL